MAQRKYRVSITPNSIDIGKRNEAECIAISRTGKIAHHLESNNADSLGTGFDCYAIGGILKGTGSASLCFLFHNLYDKMVWTYKGNEILTSST